MQMKKLEIKGYQEREVPNLYFELEKPVGSAILFPGWGYTVEMPAMFYSTSLLTDAGYNVLQTAYTYNRNPEYQALAEDEQYHWMYSDVSAAWEKLLAQQIGGGLTIVGKSLGTLAITHLLERYPLADYAKLVWLTPLIRWESLRRNLEDFEGQSLVVIGTADHHYDADLMEEIKTFPRVEVMEIEGADHGFNTQGDTLDAIALMGEIMGRVKGFLKS